MRGRDAILGATVAALALVPTLVSAQAPVVVWPAGETASSGRAELWARRVARALAADGAVDVGEAWAWAPPGIPRTRLGRIADIERTIEEAQALAGALDEDEALARLVAAEARAREAFDVPGSVAWYVEVELELAALAHQLGLSSLSTACLARAAALGPDRALRAAEAPPELVRAHDAARRARIATASTRIVVPGVDGTRVFVDDVLVGAAPVSVEVAAGAHVIRVEATGHVVWASLVELWPGVRPDVEVSLAWDPGASLAHELREAAAALDLPRVAAALRRLQALGRSPRSLVLVIAGDGALDRAAVLACSVEGCRAPVRLEGEVTTLEALEREAGGEASDVDGALGWLAEPIPDEAPPPPPPAEWWTEWWPWATVVVLAAGGVAAGLGAALYEPPAPGLVVNVEIDAP